MAFSSTTSEMVEQCLLARPNLAQRLCFVFVESVHRRLASSRCREHAHLVQNRYFVSAAIARTTRTVPSSHPAPMPQPIMPFIITSLLFLDIAIEQTTSIAAPQR